MKNTKFIIESTKEGFKINIEGQGMEIVLTLIRAMDKDEKIADFLEMALDAHKNMPESLKKMVSELND